MTEKKLEEKYLGKIVSFEVYSHLYKGKVTGKIDSITLWQGAVIFAINNTRYELELDYFTENIKVHGYNERPNGDGDVFGRV